MKKIIALTYVLFPLLIISCKKDNINNGDVLARVYYKGNQVPRATVSLFKDTTDKPLKLMVSDAIGEVSFSQLEPGDYYLFANGNWYNPYMNICGKQFVRVLYKAQSNHYDVIIDTRECR
ncbi:MAG: hypothetical protein JST82_00170 [Bacteroidetes bacterium]|nr:hypothetical protein [Bacteroidota bacterium]